MMALNKERPNYLCFTAQEDGCTISINKNGTFTDVLTEYSVNKGAFADYTYNTAISFDSGETVEFRRKPGYETNRFSINRYSKYYTIVANGDVVASGTIISLLNADCIFDGISFDYDCFARLATTISGIDIPINIPESLTTISSNCFADNTRFIGDTNLQNIKNFESFCFSSFKCERATLRLANPIEYVDIGAFSDSYLEGDVVITSSMTTIPEQTFMSCTKLSSVTIEGLITNIGYRAFFNSKNIQHLVIKAQTTPPTLGSQSFRDTNFRIYVPYSSDHSVLAAYQTAWSDYASRIYELDENGEIPE